MLGTEIFNSYLLSSAKSMKKYEPYKSFYRHTWIATAQVKMDSVKIVLSLPLIEISQITWFKQTLHLMLLQSLMEEADETKLSL